MNTPPEATPERLAWVASLKEGDEVWYHNTHKGRNERPGILKKDPVRGGRLALAWLSLRPDGSLTQKGCRAWITPLTDEEKAAQVYHHCMKTTENRLWLIGRNAGYGYGYGYGLHGEQDTVAAAVERLKRINKLLDEAGL